MYAKRIIPCLDVKTAGLLRAFLLLICVMRAILLSVRPLMTKPVPTNLCCLI